MWIGLNPSVADENQLDPTLRRIRAFSTAWGFNEFVMTNLFAYRATDPRAMLRHAEPVGPENNRVLLEHGKAALIVIACWGAHGKHLCRDVGVINLLEKFTPLFCLGLNAKDKSPRHPLYVSGTQKPLLFSP